MRTLLIPLLVALLAVLGTSQALGAVNVGAECLAGSFRMAADENDSCGACGCMCDMYRGVTTCCHEPEGEPVGGLCLGLTLSL